MTCGDLEAGELLETGLGFPAKDVVPATQSQEKWLMTRYKEMKGPPLMFTTLNLRVSN